MENKIILILLLAIIVTGCNYEVWQSGELLYKNSEKLPGRWKQDNYPKESKFIIIQSDNLNLLKREVRGINSLNLKNELGIYVSLGEQPSGGYAVEIKEIRKKGDNLLVVVEAVGPASSDFVAQVITYPYDVVKLPIEELRGIRKVIFLSVNGEKLVEKKL